MCYTLAIEHPPALVEDFLEDSQRIYHRNVTQIQMIFQARYEDIYDQELSKMPADPEWNEIEKLITYSLTSFRAELTQKCHELIEGQRIEMEQRDRGIHQFARV